MFEIFIKEYLTKIFENLKVAKEILSNEVNV